MVVTSEEQQPQPVDSVSEPRITRLLSVDPCPCGKGHASRAPALAQPAVNAADLGHPPPLEVMDLRKLNPLRWLRPGYEQFHAVAPGMRFRDKHGRVFVIPAHKDNRKSKVSSSRAT